MTAPAAPLGQILHVSAIQDNARFRTLDSEARVGNCGKAWAAAHGACFVDRVPPSLREGDPAERVCTICIRSESHFKEAGNRLIATAFAESRRPTEASRSVCAENEGR